MMKNWIPLYWFLLFLIHLCLCSEGCVQSERVALLEFKNGLTDPSNRLADWVPNSSDCCNWTGIVYHNLTFRVLELLLQALYLNDPAKFFSAQFYEYREQKEYEEYYMKSILGGKVSSSLLELKHLNYLDLSFNDFGDVTIPKFIGSMQSLRYLNLSYAGFGGIVPPQLGNLSNLNYLDISSNYLRSENLDWVTSLSSLEFLDLSGVDLSRSFDWLKVMNSIPSLIELHLSSCSIPCFSPSAQPNLNFSSLAILDLSYNGFEGPIPHGLQNMSSSLRELDLSSNDLDSSVPRWLYDLTHLQLLHLGSNSLQGQVFDGIGNLTSLVSLDLSYNPDLEFNKKILNSFQFFCSLRSLSLSWLKLSQEIDDMLAVMSRCVSSVLEYLYLSDCQLSGYLTNDLTHFRNLKYFDISKNSISGPIPLSFGNLAKLEHIDMSNNLISGSFPPSFGNLNKLKWVDMSYNKLEGEISQVHFANLTRLFDFIAPGMGENIVLRVKSNWIPPLQLQTLDLRSWNIGSKFPKWLCKLKHLTYLDLSNSEISAPIPTCFSDLLPNYYYLNFSHNQMHGSIPNVPFVDGFAVDLSFNNFSGAVPYFSSNITALDLSHNSFSGSIHNFLCYNWNEQKQLEILNLEGNLLNGEIPNCWRRWTKLVAVKLSNNSFSGHIPNSIGTLNGLKSLHLHNNNLSGEVPSSIKNCTQLFLLDLSENSLEGKIHTWIGYHFYDMRILKLHANMFDGRLPRKLCLLVSLQVLDLSRNRFSGTIPSCFGTFKAMATRSQFIGTFEVDAKGATTESTLLMMKGRIMEYSTNLGFVRSIDISSNNSYGEIPREIAQLRELMSLNMSQNALTEKILDNIGDMKGLEVIDFSHNRLFGEIPQSMTTLTFLDTLDLSYNNLSGKIPLGTQLQSFNSSSFTGNYLCGLPLTNNCTSNNPQPDSHEKEDGDDGDEVDVWFYASMAFGFVFGFWSVVGSLVFIRKWRHFYFHALYHLKEIIWWSLIGRLH